MQAKLLRVVEEHRIQRVGGGHDVPVDFRLIAATNADLATLVEEGRFRSDLYYRLNVIHLRIPPLRDRVDDIPYLASHFRDHFAHEAGFPVVPFADESLDWLMSKEWPGNVRELKHAVERAIVLSRGADAIAPSHFGYGAGPISNGMDGTLLRHVLAGWDLKRLEEEYILAVIRHTDGHRGEAAEILGIDRRTLYRKLQELEA